MTLINFQFDGGFLNGRTVMHYTLPPNPETPILFTQTKCAKGDDTDLCAQGLYHLEQRDGNWVAIHHTSEQDQDWQPVKREDVNPAEVQPGAVEIRAGEVKRPGRRLIEVPEDSPLARRLAPIAKAYLAMKKERKELKQEV